jgi:hypothetical protein
MSSKTKAPKRETLIVKYDPTRPHYVYEGIDPESGTAFYVGRTGDVLRRGAEHDRSGSRRIRALMKLRNCQFSEVVRLVPELPDGCPHERVAEFESFFIFNRKTMYDPVDNPLGCNQRIGDHAGAMDKARYDELAAELAAGFEWPERPIEDAQLAAAKARVAVLEEFVAEANQEGDAEGAERLEECFKVAVFERFLIEQRVLSVRVFTETVMKKYEGMYVDAIDVGAFQVELNALKEKLADDEVYADLTRIVTSISLVCKQKEGVDVSSEAAVGFLRGLVAMIGSREEATLVWTSEAVKKQMLATRAWTKSNGLKKPVRIVKDDPAQITLSHFLENWKVDNKIYGGKCTDLAQSRVLMRDVPWFDEFVGSKDRNADEWKEVNRQLLQGYGWHGEPEFDDKKAMPSGKANSRVYDKLSSLVRAKCSEASRDVALAGLPETRKAYYLNGWDAKRKAYLTASAARNAARRAKPASTSKRPRDDAEEDTEDDDDDE